MANNHTPQTTFDEMRPVIRRINDGAVQQLSFYPVGHQDKQPSPSSSLAWRITGSVLLITFEVSVLHIVLDSLCTSIGSIVFKCEGKDTNIFSNYQIYFSKNDHWNRPHDSHPGQWLGQIKNTGQCGCDSRTGHTECPRQTGKRLPQRSSLRLRRSLS